jgi:Na+/H+-dicarboxylate symporter
MGRTATNVIGNSIATAVVARWEGQLGPPRNGDVEPAAAKLAAAH